MVIGCVRLLVLLMLNYCEGLASPSVTPAEPFWKARSELFEQVEKERAILVSAKQLPNKKTWVFIGGGHIKSGLEESWSIARQCELLSRLTWVFNKVKYESQVQELYLTLKFLGFERNLVVKINEVKDKKRGLLEFRIIKGFFQGLNGQMGFLTYSPEVTESSVYAEFDGDVPFSSWIFARGAEVVMYYVASELRKIIERQPPVDPSHS